jgi:hypothetical protein
VGEGPAPMFVVYDEVSVAEAEGWEMLERL